MNNRKAQVLPIVLTSILSFIILGGALAYSYNGGLFDELLGRNTIKIIDKQNGSTKINTLSSTTSDSVSEAVESIKKIQFVVKSGTNFMTYDLLVNEAKLKTDKAISQLPESELKKKLILIIESYIVAQKDWQGRIKDNSISEFLKLDTGDEIDNKFKKEREKFADGKTDFPMPKDFTIQWSWLMADREISNIDLYFVGQQL